MSDSPTNFPCPVCAAPVSARKVRYRAVPDYITEEKFDVVICKNCGMGMTSPMPDDQQIGRFYSASYRGDRHAFTDQMRIGLRSRAVAKNFPSGFRGKLLDIGCGSGNFALHQKKLGWDVWVTEIHEPTNQKLREQGINAFTPQQAMDGAIPPGFDAVTCWHVLEHAILPDALAKWVYGLLGDQGIFQVSVPNLASWQARFSGRHWLHLDVPRHRYHFNDHTLRRLMKEAGFSEAHWHSVVLEYDVFGAIQSALNIICSRPNVLFERMTSRQPVPRTRAAKFDRFISYAMLPVLASVSLPMCLASEWFGAGATLDVTCRKTAHPPVKRGGEPSLNT